MSVFTKVWHWYVAGAVMGFFLSPVFYATPAIILSNWFIKKRGFVIGFAMAFSGVGGAIMNPVVASLIHNYGWRTAYVANAIIAGVVVLPFLMFVIRLKPSDMGLKPYGYEEQPDQAAQGDSTTAGLNVNQVKGVSKEDASRSVSFILVIILFAVCGYFSGYPQYLSAYGISIGFSATFASFLLSLCMIGNVFSKLALGLINDKFGGMRMMFTAFAMIIASLVLLLAGVNSFPALLAGALLSGSFYSVSTVSSPLFVHTIYGSRDYARIIVIFSLSQNLFISFGQPIVGFMYDYTGGYTRPFMFGIIVTVAAMCLTYSSFRTSRKLTWS